MCRFLKVSRSSYCRWLNKKPSKRELENNSIEKAIIQIHKESRNCYGAHKINESLKQLGIIISIKRTQRLMKKLGVKSIIVKSIIVKKYRPSSKSNIKEQENLLRTDFKATSINEKWVTDIAYIHTSKDGWCYLASVMDLYSKKIIGYSMSKSIDTTLALQAVKNAIKLQKPTKNLILHCDIGCQYTTSAFKEYIASSRIITQSFSSKGRPYIMPALSLFMHL